MNKKWLIASLSLFALSIVLGAFGAHGLKTLIPAEDLITYEVAVRYQFFGALFLLGFIMIDHHYQINKPYILTLFITGVILFSGSIYGIIFGRYFGLKASWLGPVTPIGGVLMLLAVIMLIAILSKTKQN